MRACGVSLACVLAACGGAWGQAGTADQLSPWMPIQPYQLANFEIDLPSMTWQQQVRMGTSGQLEGLRIPTIGNVGATMHFRIRLGDAWASGPAVFSAQVSKFTTGLEIVFVDVTSAGIVLAAGDTFVFEAQGNGTGMNVRGSYAPPGTTPGPLYSEPLYLNLAPHLDGRWRMGFESYVLPGAAPCYANCDGSTASPILNVADFTCFLQRYAAGEIYANCDEQTFQPVLNVQDFTCFLQRYAAGCP